MAKTFVLSDESVNTYGFRLLTSGADLEQFKKNPVMYYGHDDWSLPIGRWENIRIDGSRILADAIFDEEDERAKEIAGKVARDFVRMASVGAVPIELSEEPALMLPGQTLPTVSKWRMREASVVGIGSNHNSVRLYDKDGGRLGEQEVISLFDKPNLLTNMNKEVLKMLGLADTAAESEAIDALRLALADIRRLKEENVAFKTRIDEINALEVAAKKNEATTLVDAAVKEGRLNADGKTAFLALFEKDHNQAKATLAAIPARKGVKDLLDERTAQSDVEFKKMESQDWDTIDRAGKLTELRDKFPDLYSEKFEERFGCKPTVL